MHYDNLFVPWCSLYFRTLIGDAIPDEKSLNNQKDIEERRRKLIFELNSSGKYYAFKEKLKVRNAYM